MTARPRRRAVSAVRWLTWPARIAWRWFTGKPLDGVPRTDATWLTRGAPGPGQRAAAAPDSARGDPGRHRCGTRGDRPAPKGPARAGRMGRRASAARHRQEGG